MPNLTLSIPHQLPRAEVKRRIQEQVGKFQQQWGGKLGHLDERWNGDNLDFKFFAMGATVSGTIFVEDQAVRLELALPWLLAKLAGTVKQGIEQEGRKLLGQS
jgi:putative polyhydroxyalkanoate system protein